MALYTIYLNRGPVRDWLNDTVAAAQAEKNGIFKRVTDAAQSRVWDGFPGAVADALKARRPDDEFEVKYHDRQDVVRNHDAAGDPDAVFSLLDEAWEEASQGGWFDDADFEPAESEPV